MDGPQERHACLALYKKCTRGFWSEVYTKSELGAIATSLNFPEVGAPVLGPHFHGLTLRLVATTTPRGLPARGPRFAPSSDFVLPDNSVPRRGLDFCATPDCLSALHVWNPDSIV